MPAVAYTVTATLPDERAASEYIGWLAAGHVEEVVRAGARSGSIVRITDPPSPLRVEARYIFADAGSFERYVRDAAPALRAVGLKRFPPESRVTFERRVGTVL